MEVEIHSEVSDSSSKFMPTAEKVEGCSKNACDPDIFAQDLELHVQSGDRP